MTNHRRVVMSHDSCGQPRFKIAVEWIIEQYSKMISDWSPIMRRSCLIRLRLVPWLGWYRTKNQILTKQLILKLNRIFISFIGDYLSFYSSHVLPFWPDNYSIIQDDLSSPSSYPIDSHGMASILSHRPWVSGCIWRPPLENLMGCNYRKYKRSLSVR